MINKKQRRTIEFVEQDEGFVRQLARDIGCYYCKANERTYNLNKINSEVHSERGIFAWVHKEANDCYWVATRKIWVEVAKAKVLSGRNKFGILSFPRDTLNAEDSVCFDMKEDYLKNVRALSLINKSR